MDEAITGTKPELAAQIVRWQVDLEDASPYQVVAHAIEHYGADLALSFSGAEDVVMVDFAHQIAGQDLRVFTLDTGRLHPETYRFIERVRDHYGLSIEVVSPERVAVEQLVRRKGLFSFRRDGHHECCGVRKVEPLTRALATCRAWMTGQRRDQSPDTRAEVAVIELDGKFSGRQGPLVKYNPMARWSSGQVWRYIRGAQLPYNELHERGYVSIGCEPCTRAITPGEHERAGRWWWEEATAKECGLHALDSVDPAE